MLPFQRSVLASVAGSKWRGEVSLCLEFGGSENHAPTEDALWWLVRAGFVQWFGADDKPLRYRVTSSGRFELSLAREAGAV
jgi:hypothetical protein